MASRKKSTTRSKSGQARKQQHQSLVGRVARSIRMRIKNLVS